MCFDTDSAPPIPRHRRRSRLARRPRARPRPTATRSRRSSRRRTSRAGRGRDPAGRARALPLLRGARAALRRAWLCGARDRLLRPHRGRRRSATTTSSTCRTSSRRPTTACRPTRAPPSSGCASRACTSIFTVGFCFGGRTSWLAAASGHGLAGAVGFYGSPTRERGGAERRRSASAEIDVPDPRAAGGRRPGHHRRGQRRVRARARPARASSTRSSRTTARRTASSTASRRSSRTRPTTPGGARSSSSTRTRVILAIDQGTTGTTCLVVDDELRVRGRGYRELPQHFPQPGWVEHDPEEIWQSVGLPPRPLRTPASTRSTSRVGDHEPARDDVLWERATGQAGRARDRLAGPPHRRALPRARRELIRARTGLVPDPYFSATKLEWLLREHGARDGLAFGTVDSWLVWKLTGGAAHVTDVTNASRTMLVDLETLDWDDELLALFGVDRDAAAAHRPLGRGRRGGRAARPHASDPRHRRRPAGRALRPGLPRAGRGQGDVRHRQLRARAHRRRCERAAARAAEDRRGRRLRARGRGARRAARRCSGCATASA